MNEISRWQSFRCALAGAQYVLRTQRNAHIEMVAATLVTLLGLWLQVTRLEWALLAIAIGFVLSAEMLNTAVERAVDVATRQSDPLARLAKDAAAGGVLMAILTSVVIGLLVFGPRLWNLLLR